MLDARLACVAAGCAREAGWPTSAPITPICRSGWWGMGSAPAASPPTCAPARLKPPAARWSGQGWADSIAVRVGDGLSPVSPEEADDMVIAGMGGETIAGHPRGGSLAEGRRLPAGAPAHDPPRAFAGIPADERLFD